MHFTPPTATSQQKGMMVKNGRPVFFEKRRITDELRMVTEVLEEHRPEFPIEGPISLTLDFTYPWRKGDQASSRAAARCSRIGWDWHTNKPDTANVAKGIIDRMTKLGYWRDDAQICSEQYLKRRGSDPRLVIRIEELSPREMEANYDVIGLFEEITHG